MNKIKIFRDNTFVYIPIQEFFNYRYSKSDAWIQKDMDRVFNIKNEEEYRKLFFDLQVGCFDINKIKNKYEELSSLNLPFEDDIIKFISFLYGTDYFNLIGNPSLEQWLNAKDFNRPFVKVERKNEGYSLLEATNYKYGQNAIRNRLLTTLKWIGSQSG